MAPAQIEIEIKKLKEDSCNKDKKIQELEKSIANITIGVQTYNNTVGF